MWSHHFILKELVDCLNLLLKDKENGHMVIVIVEVTKLQTINNAYKRLAGHEYADISGDLGVDARM